MRAGFWVVGIGLVVGAASALRAEPAAPEPLAQALKTISVRISDSADGVRIIESQCVLPRPQEAVWTQLIDYDAYESYIPVLTESTVKGKEGSATILYQKGKVHVLFFSKGFQMTLRMEETAPTEVRVEAFEGDFHVYRGWWRLSRSPEGARLSHRLEVKPKFLMPTLIMKYVEHDIVEAIVRKLLAAPAGGGA